MTVGPAAAPQEAVEAGTRVHLVGIGGVGMRALAEILLARGVTVTGSDRRDGPALHALRAGGATVHVGHDAAHAQGADLVVVTNAVPPDNPELRYAREFGAPVLVRAELLERLMAGHRRVLVTGTHGKTTSTAMTAVALQAAGLDPSYAVGGTLPGAANGRHGRGGLFVAEADEAYRSFLHLTPDCAVVTNMEMDHHDVYDDLDDVAAAFEAFLARRTAGAPALLCADDPGAATLVRRVQPPVLTYGTASGADLVIRAARPDGRGGSTFALAAHGEPLGAFRLGVPGGHNVANAAAAVGVARWAGADLDAVRAALAGFTGAGRRFQRVGTAGGVAVVDDYGHHPTELAVTLAAAHDTAPDGRVVAVFQPHRYSRTAALGPALGRALAGADLVVVTEIYPAGEDPLPGVSAALVADAAAAAGTTTRRHTGPLDQLPALLADLVAPGDLVLTMGAGDITTVGPRLLEQLGGAGD